jgi:GR25 family glycosyltransferase involved in LPS biosynthesis
MIKTYSINLKKRTDRKLLMLNQFCPVNDILNFEFIEAIDGEKLGNEVPECMEKSVFGCVQSHKMAVKKAIDGNLDMVLICEDDIELCLDFKDRLEYFLKDAPEDWDGLMLGYYPSPHHPTPEAWNNHKHIRKCTGQVGAFAYILRSNIFSIFYNELSKGVLPTDFYLANIQKRHNFYAFLPRFCFVVADYSDIGKGFVEHKCIKNMYAERLEDF